MSQSTKNTFQNTPEDIENIPLTSGLYYLYDESDALMYIGRARSLRSMIHEHRDINSWVVKLGISWKEYENEISEENREKLYKKAAYIKYDVLSKSVPLVIDIIFERVKTIEIEEMPIDETKMKRAERILELQPMYNHETACEEYYDIKGYYYDD